MSLLDDTRRVTVGVPNARLVVVLDRTGLRIHPGVPLGLPELTMIAVLSAHSRPDDPDDAAAMLGGVAGDTGVTVEHLAAFIGVLAERGLLADGPRLRALPDAPAVVRDAIAEDGRLLVESPLCLRVAAGWFEAIDHDGRVRARLSARELLAASLLSQPMTRSEFVTAEVSSGAGLGADGTRLLADRLIAAGVVTSAAVGNAATFASEGVVNQMRRQLTVQSAVRESVAEHERNERERRERTGVTRTRVVPVAFDNTYAPLGLGMIVATAMAHDGGRLNEHFHFCPNWITDRDQIIEMAKEPSVFLFSTYLWSYGHCLETAKLVKQINRANITVFGGPSTPKYEGDCKLFFRKYPYVDVTARGEGEMTATLLLAALAGKVGSELREDGAPELSALADVAGLSYRDGDHVVRTANRDRIADLNTIPSPFLTGLFDAYAKVPGIDVIIETNRGCPYGCTFCDWGSATLSRIRKFDMDRVYAELEWCAKAGVKAIAPADSNFGIWSRDVDITRRVTELKKEYGAPSTFGVNFAKNTAKHLRTIIQLLIEADIFTYGVLSLQSMDEDTLDAIERQNIRLEKYEELATEFRAAGLPLFVDLMIGLPGQTPASFMNDLQECIDREVQIRIPITTMLVNSPMNDPDYRKKFRIVTANSPLDPGVAALVVQTSTFTEQQYNEMRDLRLAVLLSEDLGVIRHLSRYVRAETGMREVDFFDGLQRAAAADPDRWPATALTMQVIPHIGVPPVSWRLFDDEILEYVTNVLGVADDSALRTVMTVQHALQPARDRELPVTLELEHDIADWHRRMIGAKEAGHRRDWHDVVPPLRSFPPATFVIDDRHNVTTWSMGMSVEYHGFGVHWELGSAMSRPVANLASLAGSN